MRCFDIKRKQKWNDGIFFFLLVLGKMRTAGRGLSLVRGQIPEQTGGGEEEGSGPGAVFSSFESKIISTNN